MKAIFDLAEKFLEAGGIRKDILLLVIAGISILLSLADYSPVPFDMAWVAIVLCGIPIVLEALIGLITAFDIKADVLVSLALIAAVLIGEDFAAGEVAFIMQLGALLEEDREIFYRFYDLSQTTAQIADALHLNASTVRSRLMRGRETLRKLLSKGGLFHEDDVG